MSLAASTTPKTSLCGVTATEALQCRRWRLAALLKIAMTVCLCWCVGAAVANGPAAVFANSFEGTPAITGPDGNVNTPQGGTIGFVTARLTDQQFAHQFSAPANRPAAPPDTIAYIVSNSTEISLRLIGSDGRNDRQILTLPNAPHSADAPNAMQESVIFDGTHLASRRHRACFHQQLRGGRAAYRDLRRHHRRIERAPVDRRSPTHRISQLFARHRPC